MGPPSCKSKIRNLERLKQKLGEGADTTEIDGKIKSLQEQIEINKLNTKERNEINKKNRSKHKSIGNTPEVRDLIYNSIYSLLIYLFIQHKQSKKRSAPADKIDSIDIPDHTVNNNEPKPKKLKTSNEVKPTIPIIPSKNNAIEDDPFFIAPKITGNGKATGEIDGEDGNPQEYHFKNISKGRIRLYIYIMYSWDVNIYRRNITYQC